MRREVDNEKTPAGAEHTGRLRQRPLRVVEIVQYLMDGDDVEGIPPEGQIVDVAQTDLGAGDTGTVEIGAGDRQHVGGGIDADGADVQRREQFQEAAGTGAEIEEAVEG